MSFADPVVLVALLAIPALACWYVVQQRGRAHAAEAFVVPVLRPAVAPQHAAILRVERPDTPANAVLSARETDNHHVVVVQRGRGDRVQAPVRLQRLDLRLVRRAAAAGRRDAAAGARLPRDADGLLLPVGAGAVTAMSGLRILYSEFCILPFLP